MCLCRQQITLCHIPNIINVIINKSGPRKEPWGNTTVYISKLLIIIMIRYKLFSVGKIARKPSKNRTHNTTLMKFLEKCIVVHGVKCLRQVQEIAINGVIIANSSTQFF